jgi:hypothetical protein
MVRSCWGAGTLAATVSTDAERGFSSSRSSSARVRVRSPASIRTLDAGALQIRAQFA